MPYRRSRLQDYYEQLLGDKPAETQEESTSTQPSKPDPVAGPPPFDFGPSPYLTQEATSYAQPPSTDEEANRREQRIESAMQRFEDAQQSATPPQSRSDGAQTETLPDIDENELRYVAEVGEITVHPVDMDYRIAAQYNAVLNEVRVMVLDEGVPSALQSNPDLLLSLCAEYGIDEENDAEARDYLDHITNGSSSHQNTDDLLYAARKEALQNFDMDNAEESFEAYKAAVEEKYGVTFGDIFEDGDKGDVWDLANIVMAHEALEMAASVFGARLRDISGFYIDDAIAFQLIFGPLNINLSSRISDVEAHARVEGSNIIVFWNRDEDRSYNLLPYVLLHELGHRLNLLAGLGVREGYGSLSINEDFDHPRTRGGMGQSAHRKLYEFVDVSANHGMYDAADLNATHVELLQYGELSDHNEVTADAVLNWLVHQATGGESGFVNTAEGQDWLDFMNEHIDAWIKNAIVYNAHRQGIIASLADEGLISSIAGTGIVIVPENSTATVRSTHSQAGAEIAHLRRDEEVLLLGESEPDVHGYPWNAVWAHDIYWVRSDLIRVTWTERHTVTELKAKQWFHTLLELLARR